jgi:putative copper export protein
MGLFSGFSRISKGIKGRFSNAINEAGAGLKKVGKFVKPIAVGINTASALLNTPWGQALLYGTGAMFGPAGLAAAGVISSASKAALITTSLARARRRQHSGGTQRPHSC